MQLTYTEDSNGAGSCVKIESLGLIIYTQSFRDGRMYVHAWGVVVCQLFCDLFSAICSHPAKTVVKRVASACECSILAIC